MSLEIKNLSFSYAQQPVLEGLDLRVGEGELVSVIGKNGAGKTTLLRCILGLLPNYTGEITVDGYDIRTLSHRRLAQSIAYIPQTHYPAFNYSVFEMVLMGTVSQLAPGANPGKAQKKLAARALAQMGIEPLSSKSYAKISGGERQLVLFARALAQNARVLILDEPTANLDYRNRLLIMQQARRLAASGYTILQSTHDPEQAYLFSDRILALKDGTIAKQGAPHQVITTETMRALYGEGLRVESILDDQMRVIIPDFIRKGINENEKDNIRNITSDPAADADERLRALG
jgi:iron complex transport system ATP-binding protein